VRTQIDSILVLTDRKLRTIKISMSKRLSDPMSPRKTAEPFFQRTTHTARNTQPVISECQPIQLRSFRNISMEETNYY